MGSKAGAASKPLDHGLDHSSRWPEWTDGRLGLWGREDATLVQQEERRAVNKSTEGPQGHRDQAPRVAVCGHLRRSGRQHNGRGMGPRRVSQGLWPGRGKARGSATGRLCSQMSPHGVLRAEGAWKGAAPGSHAGRATAGR